MKKKALFCGSFYPPTLGHLDIIRRACPFFSHLYVAIAENPNKTPPLLPIEERKKMLLLITNNLPSVIVTSFDTLAVDFAKKEGIEVLVRALRNSEDWEREYAMAVANRKISGLETLFLAADPSFAHIHAEIVREIAHFGGNLAGFVPHEIEKIVAERLKGLS